MRPLSPFWRSASQRKIMDNWYKVTKYYQGGMSEFQIMIPAGIKLSKSDWDSVLEWIGENTSGGHNYGYRLKTRKLRAKSAKLKVLAYPSNVCAKLFDHGREVITKRKMIGV